MSNNQFSDQDSDVYERSLAHDIREINKQLKAAAERVRETFKRNRNIIGRAETDGHKVFFASEMITKRLDVYEFYKNRSTISTTEKTYAIHRVITKISKILEERAQKKNLQVYIEDSHLEITTSTKFEVALFVIFENFIKYAPEKESIRIKIIDNEHNTTITFNAFGPLATQKEQESLFNLENRARMARKMTGEGSGIGLHFAKAVCDLHGFAIEFDQDPSKAKSQKGIDFHCTEVSILIPKNR